MSPSQELNVTAPEYVQKFECLGAECPDSCCAEKWSIPIDKNTYKKIHMLSNSVEHKKIKSLFKINKNGKISALDYARPKIDDSGCALQTETGLCSVHEKVGAHYLSHTCRLYPRLDFNTAYGIERYLSLSCPEAARLCVTQESAWELTSYRLTASEFGVVSSRQLTVSNYPALNKAGQKKISLLLKKFVTDIISSDQGEFWEKLLLVALTLKKIDELLCQQEMNEEKLLPKAEFLLLDAKLNFFNASFASAVKSLLKGYDIDFMQSRFIEIISNELTASDVANDIFRSCILNSFDGHNLVLNNKADYTSFYVFEKCHPHVWARIFLNLVGTEDFPHYDQSLLDQWSKVVLKFAMLKLYSKGISVVKAGDFGLNDIVQVLYSFSRNIVNNATFIPRLTKKLASSGLQGTAPLVIMTK